MFYGAGVLGFGFLLFFFIVVAIVLLPLIFYLLTLQRALNKCSPYNRTMPPGHVWLQIIPVFGLVWQFFVVGALSASLSREYAARRMQIEPEPGRSLGIAMAVLACCALIPYVGFLAALAHLVLWIMYWVKIANYSRALDFALPYAARPGGPPSHQQAPGYGSPAYGAPPYSMSLYGAPPYSTPPHSTAPHTAAAAPVGTVPGYQAPSYLPPQPPASDPARTSPTGWLSANARGTSNTCAACGATLAEGSEFCGSCGAKVD